MKTEKVMAVFAALLLGLSMVGVTYAAWYDFVEIDARVHMGELILGWLDVYDLVETTNGFPEDEPGHNFEPKDWVANTFVNFDNPETSVHLDPPKTVFKTMIIEVENAYPQYDVHLVAYLSNGGTIPVCVYTDFGLYLWDVSDNHELLFEITAGGYWDAGRYFVEGNIVDPILGEAIMTFSFQIFDDDDTLQIDECESDEVRIDIEFTQDAEECHTYEFEITILGIQWNKLHEAPIYAP